MRGFSPTPDPQSDQPVQNPVQSPAVGDASAPTEDNPLDSNGDHAERNGDAQEGANGSQVAGAERSNTNQQARGRWEHDKAEGAPVDDRWAPVRRGRSRSHDRTGRTDRQNLRSSEWRSSASARERDQHVVPDTSSAPSSASDRLLFRYKILLPFATVGGPIIGRSGATQKRIKNESSLHVLRIHQPKMEDGMVEVVGTEGGIKNALGLIEEVVYSQNEKWDSRSQEVLDRSRTWLEFDETRLEKLGSGEVDAILRDQGRREGPSDRSRRDGTSSRSSRRRSHSPPPRRGRSPSPASSASSRLNPPGGLRRSTPPPPERILYTLSSTFPIRKIGGLFHGPEGRTAARLVACSGLAHFEVRRTEALHAIGMLSGSKAAIERAITIMRKAVYEESYHAWNEWERSKLGNQSWCDYDERSCMEERGIWLEKEDDSPSLPLKEGEGFLLNTSRNALDFADQNLPPAPRQPYSGRGGPPAGGDGRGPKFAPGGGGGGGGRPSRGGHDDRRPPPPQRPSGRDDRWGGSGPRESDDLARVVDRVPGKGVGLPLPVAEAEGLGARRALARPSVAAVLPRLAAALPLLVAALPLLAAALPLLAAALLRLAGDRFRHRGDSGARPRIRWMWMGKTIPATAAPKFLGGSATTSFIEDATSCSVVLHSSRTSCTLRIEGPNEEAVESAEKDIERVVGKVVKGWRSFPPVALPQASHGLFLPNLDPKLEMYRPVADAEV
ncbi:hypothetical protein JCM11641_000911 [Rhodosporidiobolus odoratus]